MSSQRLRRPTERTCERCGREEIWRDGSWRIVEGAEGRRTGSVYCIHEWDINGTFLPFEREEA